MLKFIITASFISIFLIQSTAHSFKEETHSSLSEMAINSPIGHETLDFNLNNFLIDTLDMKRGVEEPLLYLFNFQTFSFVPISAEQNFIRGSYLEDTPPRWLNHFHHALTGYGLMTVPDSALYYAQLPVGGQDFSWNDARYYYYRALTSDKSFLRNESFAQAFRSIGQVMHLVEDMAVPEHTRNDAHPFSPGIEAYIEKKVEDPLSNYSAKFSDPFFFDFKTLQTTPSAFQGGAPVPIANLFDTNIYTDTNAEVTVDNTVGLAEYSNANFLSIDTNPVSSQVSMPPYLTSTIAQAMDIPHPQNPEQIIKRWYYVKDRAGETAGGVGYKLTAMSVLSFYSQDLQHAIELSVPILDEHVYDDYAKLLLPRAAGYAATLLRYFFRGNIELSLPDRTGTYALSTLGQSGFDTIRIDAQNVTVNDEEMPSGTVELVVKYKTALEDPFQGVPVPVSDDFTYLVVPEANGVTSIPRDEPIELVFDLSQTPIPFNATDLTLQVVYRGEMGFQTPSGFVGETEAVAVGFQDISEPTPIDYINSMDVVCVNNEILPAGSDKAVNTLDPEGKPISDYVDVYPHDLFDNYLKYSPRSTVTRASSSSYDVAVPYLSAGHYARHFVLTEPYGTFAVLSNQMELLDLDPRDDFFHWTQTTYPLVQGVINQVNMIDGVLTRQFSGMFDTRGIKFWTGVYWTNQDYPFDTTCDESESSIPLAGPEPVEL